MNICKDPQTVLFFGNCIDVVYPNIVFCLIAVAILSYILRWFLLPLFKKESDYHGPFHKKASYKPLPKATFEQIAVHELGHAFVVMYYPSLMKKALLHIFDKEIENFNQGYVYYEIDSNVESTNPGVLELKMLILLGGMQAEKHYYEGNCLINGSQSDLDQWMRMAQLYYLNQDDVIFFNHPSNKYEHQHNLSLLMEAKERQVRTLSDFFNANAELFSEFVGEVLRKRHLNHEELTAISKRIKETGHMPRVTVKQDLDQTIQTIKSN